MKIYIPDQPELALLRAEAGQFLGRCWDVDDIAAGRIALKETRLHRTLVRSCISTRIRGRNTQSTSPLPLPTLFAAQMARLETLGDFRNLTNSNLKGREKE